MKHFLFILFLLPIFCFGQHPDSLMRLQLKEFLAIVNQYHPIAKQAKIEVEKAKAQRLSAKAGFDPVLQIDADKKTFDGVNYYQTTQTQLSLPTWYGIEVKAGTEFLTGDRTDPQVTLGKTNFTGITVPLAKNLLMDKRRAALQQAKIMVEATEQTRIMMLNDLKLEAVNAYWKWVESYLIYKNYDDILLTNRKRFDAVKLTVTVGERPTIDTTEALAQLQSFEYAQNQAALDFQNSTVALSAFLWQGNNNSYELPASVRPQEVLLELFDGVTFPELNQILDVALKTHPELKVYDYKLRMQEIDRKLKFQDLLPKVDLKWNQLGKGYDVANTFTKFQFDNNYKFGIGFSMPLRLSQGRGDYKLAKLKISETNLLQSNKATGIAVKVKSYFNELVNLKLQVALLQKNYKNYFALQKGEELRFFNGESSLFLINTRENKALETYLKLIETTIKYNKSSYGLQWAAGRLWAL